MAPILPSRLVNSFPLTETGELDFSDLEEKYAVSYEEGFDNFIVVDNCPIVADDVRKQKLIAYLRRIFSTNGTIREDGIYMPMGQNPETGKMESKGYVFIEYDTPEQAAAAIRTKHGHPLDKSHRLSVNRFTDVEKYSTAPDEYVEPEIESYVPKVKSYHLEGISLFQEHLRSWLKDPQARDQFLLYKDLELSVCFNNGKNEAPEVVKSRVVSEIILDATDL